MTVQNMKPCPKCGSHDVAVYLYDNGWRHVECYECDYLGPGEGSSIAAVKSHNAQCAAPNAEPPK
jgi:uncharacterized metal-binding protein (TIGR02443 family)